MTDIVYKIRRKNDGQYSMGGTKPRFTKNGKIWKQKNHLTLHLNQIDTTPRQNGKHIYSDCEILPLKLVQTVVGEIMTIDEYLTQRAHNIAKEDAHWKKVKEERARAERKKEYDKLKKEFENP